MTLYAMVIRESTSDSFHVEFPELAKSVYISESYIRNRLTLTPDVPVTKMFAKGTPKSPISCLIPYDFVGGVKRWSIQFGRTYATMCGEDIVSGESLSRKSKTTIPDIVEVKTLSLSSDDEGVTKVAETSHIVARISALDSLL